MVTTSTSVEQKAKDPMRSTWRRTDRSRWSSFHWFFEITNIHLIDVDAAVSVPVHKKEDKMPHMTELTVHRWILTHAALPVALQQLYCTWTGSNLGSVAAFALYSGAFALNGILLLQALRGFGRQVGFLDGDRHERDDVPDGEVARVFFSLLYSPLVRPLLLVLLTYGGVGESSPRQAGWGCWLWLLAEIGVYGIVLDFWFYWYHRLMHEVPFLWRFHRTHHLSRHPNPLLTLYANRGQEVLDVAGIPALAWATMRLLGLPMGFYEWWFCNQYVLFTEVAGHSGLRLLASPPSTLTWLLRMVGGELVIEDHDLHHRQGWRKSGNYGKQTRLWDVLFGTCKDRIETCPDRIDWDTAIGMPWI